MPQRTNHSRRHGFGGLEWPEVQGPQPIKAADVPVATAWGSADVVAQLHRSTCSSAHDCCLVLQSTSLQCHLSIHFVEYVALNIDEKFQFRVPGPCKQIASCCELLWAPAVHVFTSAHCAENLACVEAFSGVGCIADAFRDSAAQ